ncbi:hypothetical protein [Synechococcus sp. CBW1107]|uniref:hypothetical protein n=1 Tax=Synechococcus sp. CBW1107 TaxID=2789857 RepID=UPI002AD39EE8|nr:hypothetical protein [Synechococcus sp. CBW1107]
MPDQTAILTGGKIIRRWQHIPVPGSSLEGFRLKRNNVVAAAIIFKNRHQFLQLIVLANSIQQPTFFASLETRLMLQDEAQIRQALPRIMAGIKIVTDNSIQHKPITPACCHPRAWRGGPNG